MCIIQGGTTNGTRAGWLRNTWHLPQNAERAMVLAYSTENALNVMEKVTIIAATILEKRYARVAEVLDTSSSPFRA